MNDGLDDGAAKRIQKEQVFLIKPSLSLFAHSRRFKKSRRSEQKKAGQEHQTKRGPVLLKPDTQISGATASWGVITRVFVGFNLPPIALAKCRFSSRQRPRLLFSFLLSFLLSFSSLYCHLCFSLPPLQCAASPLFSPTLVSRCCAESTTQQPERTQLHLVRPRHH